MCKVHNHDLVLPLHMYLHRWHFSDTFIELTRMLLHFSLWSSSLHGLLLILMDPHKRQEKHSFNREPDNAARMFSGTVVLQKMKISLRPHSMWSMWPLQECLSSTRVFEFYKGANEHWQQECRHSGWRVLQGINQEYWKIEKNVYVWTCTIHMSYWPKCGQNGWILALFLNEGSIQPLNKLGQ